MKILFGTDNFYPNVNGAANFSYELAKRLVKAGHDISVITPAREFKHTITSQEGMTIYGIPSVKIPKIIHPGGMRLSFLINPVTVKAMVKEINPDIIHVQDHFMIGDTVVKAGKKLGIPLIGTNHFMPENFLHYFYPPDFVKKPLSKFGWWQLINVYKYVDLITTPTETAGNLIKNLKLRKPVLAISCGIDLNRFNHKNKGDYLKKRLQISPTRPVILFVGRLDKEKNIDIVVKAFSIILKSIDAQLVIAGKGQEKTNLVKLSKKLGISQQVTFTGFIADKDLPALYQMANVFTIASIAELQSIATMEAMASGLPVVAARVMALPELVHHGKNGYLFNEGDVNSLADSVVKILKNKVLSKKMSENSLKIIKHHDIKNTIKAYEKLYKSLILTSKSRAA